MSAAQVSEDALPEEIREAVRNERIVRATVIGLWAAAALFVALVVGLVMIAR